MIEQTKTKKKDTVRNHFDIYINESLDVNAGPFNKYEVACRVINYLHYVFSFNSAYIVVAFTVQRLVLFCRPLSTSFKTKRSAWKTVKIIGVLSLFLNIWVPIFYSSNPKDYCDIDTNLKSKFHAIGII